MDSVTTTSNPPAPARPSGAGLIEVRLTAIRYVAHETSLFEFQSLDGRPLPAYEPGAHIDLHLPSGLLRNYSLAATYGVLILSILVVYASVYRQLLRRQGEVF